jgi:uncharacterized protein
MTYPFDRLNNLQWTLSVPRSIQFCDSQISKEIIMGSPIVHWELWSKNPEKVSDFYAKIFDWKIRHMPELNYRVVETGGQGGINGGIMKPQHDEPWPGNMTFYINVDDLAACRQRIVEAGGKIIVEEQEVTGMGAFSLFTDPEGRMMGLWKHMTNR